MSASFAETLKALRTERNLSQQQLSEKLFVDRSSVAHWENGRRVPNAILMSRIAKALDVDVGFLLSTVTGGDDEKPCVIVVDDEKIILTGEMTTLEKAMPNASITGFTNPLEALEFAKCNNVSIAFTDIEMGRVNGIDLCKSLIAINSTTNVIFLTAFPDYSYEAWGTDASGFLIKPITEATVEKQLERLRYPVTRLKNS